jgi:hypothetical protein
METDEKKETASCSMEGEGKELVCTGMETEEMKDDKMEEEQS